MVSRWIPECPIPANAAETEPHRGPPRPRVGRSLFGDLKMLSGCFGMHLHKTQHKEVDFAELGMAPSLSWNCCVEPPKGKVQGGNVKLQWRSAASLFICTGPLLGSHVFVCGFISLSEAISKGKACIGLGLHFPLPVSRSFSSLQLQPSPASMKVSTVRCKERNPLWAYLVRGLQKQGFGAGIRIHGRRYTCCQPLGPEVHHR